MRKQSNVLKLIGGKLRDQRLKQNLSTKAVASKIGITTSHLEEIETGLHDFDLALLFAICKQYKIDAREIVADI